MTEQLTLKNRIIFTGIVTVLIWTHLAWDHFHGGVPTHHMLQQQDMPGISNWWGGVVIPLLTWFLLTLIQRSLNNMDPAESSKNVKNIIYRFNTALVFGLLLSVFFTMGSELPGYMMIGAMVLSFFLPIYRPEYLLGFILGMTYTFGPILPILFGLLLTVIGLIAYKVVRFGLLYLVGKIKR